MTPDTAISGPALGARPDRPASPQGGYGDGHRPGRRAEKKLIEGAYRLGKSLGLAVWCCDQAGPFQTVPHPGPNWRPEGDPARQPHEYIRNGTAKVLTLFHPADGRVRIEGVATCPNAVLHPWLKRELWEILAGLPDPPPTATASRAAWERWQAGLAVKPTLPTELPPLRMLLVLDNLAGHKTPEFVQYQQHPQRRQLRRQRRLDRQSGCQRSHAARDAVAVEAGRATQPGVSDNSRFRRGATPHWDRSQRPRCAPGRRRGGDGVSTLAVPLRIYSWGWRAGVGPLRSPSCRGEARSGTAPPGRGARAARPSDLPSR